MEILRHDFEASLSMLQKAIAECDFVAMDTEMTGLAYPANIPKFQDSLATRYSKVSTSAAEFLVIQLGICTFTWSDEVGGYEARPFNFPCFPSSVDEAKAGERFFNCQSTSLEFLIRNGFDFNKWIRHGIPYLTRTEEELYIIRKTEKEALHSTISTTQTDIPMDDRNREFMLSTVEKIREWVQSSAEEPLTIPAPNSFFRRLVYQIVRTDFNDALHAISNSQARTMTLQHLTEEIRLQKEQAKIPKAPTLNLRRILDLISDSRKPLIGHNCFLDLMQISQQFLWNLPIDLEEWKRALTAEWNLIIDTKHLATHPLISPLLATTGLDTVSECVQKAPFATVGPKIVMAESFDRYQADASLTSTEVAAEGSVENKTGGEKGETKYHEAGYDAYITGQAFLRFAGYILKERERLSIEQEEHTRKKRRLNDAGLDDEQVGISQEDDTPVTSSGESSQEQGDEEAEEGEVSETPMEKDAFLERQKRSIIDNPTRAILETEELKDYYNMLHMMRSDINVMNLTGPDQEPQERPWSYLLKNIPPNFQTSTLFQLFTSYNPFRFNWVDGTSAWIQLNLHAPAREGEESTREPYEPTPLPLGRLGEDYVYPLCVGEEDVAVKGRAVGIVPEAADIEVMSWRAWYDEREELERQSRELVKQQQATPRENNGRYQAKSIRGLGSFPVKAAAALPLHMANGGQGEEPVQPEKAATAQTDADASPEAITGIKRKHDDTEDFKSLI
ncbi:hypothetical protein BGX27_011392 [Mortierella sp. AM989]|nr:hypothetical protein BGX27_011392 [Mortierella sp. AM989]